MFASGARLLSVTWALRAVTLAVAVFFTVDALPT